MSAVTRDDLLVILRFGIHMAKVDHEFAVWEKQLLVRFAEAMHLSEAEREHLQEQPLSLAQGLRQLSGPEARSLLLKTLCAVASSDGRNHPSEVEFIHKVIEIMGSEAFVLPESEWNTYEPEVMETVSEVE